MLPFKPFQNLYQHIKKSDIKLFQTLDKISQYLQDTIAGVTSVDDSLKEFKSASGIPELKHPNVVTRVGSKAGQIVEGGITDLSPANSGSVNIDQSGKVAIGATVPLGNLAIHPVANYNDIASAKQLIIGEPTGTDGYYMGLGYFLDGSVFKGTIQAYFGVNGQATLVLNSVGGRIGIGTKDPNGHVGITPQATPTSYTDQPQVFIGEAGNNPGYFLSLMYLYDGTNWAGSIQAKSLNNPSNVIINGQGGKVGINQVNPAYQLDVNGDCNLSAGSVYRINGVPISSGGSGALSTMTNQTGSRVLGTIYANTVKPIWVSVIMSLSASGAWAQAVSDANPSPSTVVAVTQTATGAQSGHLGFWVMPNHFFKVSFNAGSGSIFNWYEYV